MFWLALALKLVLTAAIVVAASTVVERAGPLIGALVVTLPVTTGPAYIFLAMDHDAAYIASSAIAGIAVTAVTGLFMLLYLVLAQQRSLLVSLGIALAGWIGLAGLVLQHDWSLYGAGLLTLATFVACFRISRRYRDATVPMIARPWYELPLRVILVCALMAAILVLGQWAGPQATGMLAVFPLSTTCSMLILHSRLGGRVAAAVVANGLWGVFGIGIGLFLAAGTAQTWGKPAAIGVGLVVLPASWNLLVWYLRRRGHSSIRLRRARTRQ